MITPDNSESEVERLERLWAGSFGDDYTDRNEDGFGHREAFWAELIESRGVTSVLEVGCNVGGNLRWIAPLVPEGLVVGVDINRKAISTIHRHLPEAGALWSPGRDLPFRDRHFDLVFTMGVLIHQPDTTLPLVMSEMVRCSSRYVLFGEYASEETTEVPYRGHAGALFRRNYGRIFNDLFPTMTQVDEGFLPLSEGWDDVTWWLFERL